MKKGFFVLPIILLSLGACSQVELPSNNQEIDFVESKLINAAHSISHSLTELASIESANAESSSLPAPLDAEEIGMAAKVSLEWVGPIEPLINRLASKTSYTVHYLGSQPPMPVIVSISAHNQSMASILRNAKYQAQKFADIAVYPTTKIIELRYKN